MLTLIRAEIALNDSENNLERDEEEFKGFLMTDLDATPAEADQLMKLLCQIVEEYSTTLQTTPPSASQTQNYAPAKEIPSIREGKI